MFSLCLWIISLWDGMMFTFSVLSMAVAPVCEFGTMKTVHGQTSKGILKEGKKISVLQNDIFCFIFHPFHLISHETIWEGKLF